MSGDDAVQTQKRRIAVLGVSSILLVAMVAAVAVGINKTETEEKKSSVISTSQRNVDTLCLSAEYKETCRKSVEKVASDDNADMKALIKGAFKATAEEITKQIHNSTLYKDLEKDHSSKEALNVCKEVFGYAVKSIDDSIDKLDQFNLSNIGDIAYDLKVWLNGAITMQHTCLDGFNKSTSEAGKEMAQVLKTSLEMSNNALDIVDALASVVADFDLDDFDLDDVHSDAHAPEAKNKSRKLLATSSSSSSSSSEEIPKWVNEDHRRLIEVGGKALKPDAVVAQDGSGQFKTLTEALKTVPPNNNKPFVIHVKAGVYKEAVVVEANTMNFVTVVGDGPTKTRFTGSKSQKSGVATFNSATFAVNAMHFMAVDIGFENTAGANAGPAVALRITGDKAVVYRCHVDGHQDTLYPSAFRQFYRDCTVGGTIDFIFGDAVTVFQNCTILVKKGVEGQELVVAAGGKTQQAGPSALVFHACKFLADPSYSEMAAAKSGLKISYLARPWKPYAKTVIIESFIDEVFNPKGYIPFVGSTYESTCIALEYNNKGPGAEVSQRVAWPGVNPKLAQHQAAGYYPGKYFQLAHQEGDSWIVASGVPYKIGSL